MATRRHATPRVHRKGEFCTTRVRAPCLESRGFFYSQGRRHTLQLTPDFKTRQWTLKSFISALNVPDAASNYCPSQARQGPDSVDMCSSLSISCEQCGTTTLHPDHRGGVESVLGLRAATPQPKIPRPSTRNANPHQKKGRVGL